MTALNSSPTSLLPGFLDALLTIDANALARQFAPAGQFRLGHRPTATGRDAIRKAFVRLLARIASLDLEFVHHWSKDGVTIAELDVTIHRDDGLILTGPVTLDLWVAQGQIVTCCLRIYDEANWPV